MSHLVAIAYPDVATATQVRDRLIGMSKENLVQFEDIAVVEKKPDGKIKMHQAAGSPAGNGALWGAVWGGVIGMLFFMPLLGMAFGAGGGALGGAMTDYGIDDDFMKELGANLQPGGAALFVLIVQSTPDKVVPEIASYGGQLVKTSLSAEQEKELRELAQASRSAG